jgi:uncharacterized membrane protein (UPF0127 family)
MISIKPRSALALWAALLLALVVPVVQAQNGPQPRLQTIELTAGMHVIRAELAITPQQQATGMMFRKEMGPTKACCSSMPRPRAALLLDAQHADSAVHRLHRRRRHHRQHRRHAPQSDDSHCSAKPVRFALEMRQGWFAKRGIQAGARLRGAPFGN